MSRAEEKIKMHTNIAENVLEKWRTQDIDMERLAKCLQILHFFIGTGYIDQPWQYDLLTTGYARDAMIIPPDQYGNSVAHFAALIGDIALLDSILAEKKEDLSKENKEGFHLGHFAAASKDPTAMEWMAKHPELAPLLQQESNNGVLPIHVAAQSGVIKNLTFFAQHFSNALYATTRQSMPLTVLDHALLSGSPTMLAYAADLFNIQPGTANFRNSAFGSEPISTLTAAIDLSYRLVGANIPDHTSCGLYCSKQNFQRADENTARLSAIAIASREKRKSGASVYLALIALAPALRQKDRTTLRICSDVFWTIVDFVNDFGPVIKEKTLYFGLRYDSTFTYKEISQHPSEESLRENNIDKKSQFAS